MRMARVITLGIIVCLHACGGGGSDGAPMAEPPPPTPVQLTLDAANYQGAVRNALEWSDSAFFFAKLGADVADHLVRTSATLPPLFRCTVSGAASITLTDRNRNGMLNAGDTLSLFMDRCITEVIGVTGVIRVEVTSAEPLGDGRAYQLLVHIIDLSLTSNSAADVPPLDINLSASLDFSYTTDFDHYVLTFGEFRRTLAGQTQSCVEPCDRLPATLRHIEIRLSAAGHAGFPGKRRRVSCQHAAVVHGDHWVVPERRATRLEWRREFHRAGLRGRRGGQQQRGGAGVSGHQRRWRGGFRSAGARLDAALAPGNLQLTSRPFPGRVAADSLTGGYRLRKVCATPLHFIHTTPPGVLLV